MIVPMSVTRTFSPLMSPVRLLTVPVTPPRADVGAGVAAAGAAAVGVSRAGGGSLSEAGAQEESASAGSTSAKRVIA